MIQPERVPYQDAMLVCVITLFLIFSVFGYMIATTPPKPKVVVPVVTVAPTAIVTATPAPVITESPDAYRTRTNGYKVREYLHWFRENVSGYHDMSTWVTVYGYKILPQYHYHSVSWGTRAFFVEKPEKGTVFLFDFVNMYSDGDDVRQYGFDRNHFYVNIGETTYYPQDVYNPSYQILELDEVWDYAHVESIKPYGYKIIQEGGTGIIRAEEQDVIYAGRSNAWDGWIAYQIPVDTPIENIKVLGEFANLGGHAWWQLE